MGQYRRRRHRCRVRIFPREIATKCNVQVLEYEGRVHRVATDPDETSDETSDETETTTRSQCHATTLPTTMPDLLVKARSHRPKVVSGSP